MIRRFMSAGALALALAALASSAQASTFKAEKYPATITGTQVGQHVFTVEKGLTVKCNSATFQGVLAEASSTMTITPTYTECTAFGLASTVAFNGCDYLFHAGEEVAADVHRGTVDIACPAGKQIVITAGSSICEIAVPPQTGLGSSNIENNTNPMDATATGSLTGITYNKLKDTFFCPLEGTGTKTDGGYSGTATAIGESGGTQVGIWIEG